MRCRRPTFPKFKVALSSLLPLTWVTKTTLRPSTKMSINNLPPELLHYILNLVTASSKPFSEPNVVLRNKEYYRTALVCKSWNQHATPMLYIAVRIYYANPCSRFLRNLETTNLGQCIKTLRLEYVCWIVPKMWHGRDVMSELLWKLGELAPNLNNLCIIGRQAIEDAWLFGLKSESLHMMLYE